MRKLFSLVIMAGALAVAGGPLAAPSEASGGYGPAAEPPPGADAPRPTPPEGSRPFGERGGALGSPASGIQAPAAPGAAAAPERPALPEDPRALWVVRDGLLSPAGIHRMVADAAGAGITDLFVQVRGRGDAWYQSDLVPMPVQLREAQSRYGPFDPLATVIELAHERGIRVHAWMNVYLVRSGDLPLDPGHVAVEHPEWIAVDRTGTSMLAMSARRLKNSWTEGAYLEPGNGEVVRRFLAVVEELVARYPVDGIHLDYVRYPAMDVGYSQAMRDGFRRHYGIDPRELQANEGGLRRERGDAGYAELVRDWRAWKAAQVTALVADVRQVTLRMRPDLILSAAVKPDPDTAFDEVGQDWVRWVREGLVDVVAPMMYSASGEVVARQAADLARRVPPDRVWAGIAVYNQSLASAEAKIRSCRAAGLGGISIYSYNSLPGGGRNLERLSRAR